MRILMLGWELPPHNSGGLGVACLELSKALVDCGVAIDFVVPYQADHHHIRHMHVHPATRNQPSSPGLQAYDHGTVASPDAHGLERIQAVQQQYCQFVRQLAHRQTPDIIHAHDWLTVEAGLAARQVCGVPLIVHVHGTEFDRSGEHQGNPLVHDIEQQGLLRADKIIAVSQLTKDSIVQRYHIPADTIEVVHNAIDVASLSLQPSEQSTYHYLEELKATGHTVVGTLTRLTVQKGLTYFIRAAAQALQHDPKLVFVVAGSGEQRDELIALAASLGISDKVLFTGFVRGKQWRDVYRVLDVFVMSSVSEPFGLTALEAAHYDTALLLSRQSGVGEVLEHAIRFDYWDIDRLANQLVRLARSPSLQRSLKQRVKQEYAQLSWQNVARRCLDLYSNALRGSN